MTGRPISFIVPARNEALEIPRTLEAITASAHAIGLSFEIIVVNDGSTDQTAELARSAGARVVDVSLQQISAVRNAGARQAQGDVFFFVDADTRLSESVLRSALAALNQGAIGGGAWVAFADRVGPVARGALEVFSFFYSGLMKWAAGCFIFARREAFEAVGGFDETLFAGEEILLSIALKRQGSFVIVRERVRTSGRKLRLHSAWNIVPFALRFLRYGPSLLRQRRGLEWWYDGQREKPDAHLLPRRRK